MKRMFSVVIFLTVASFGLISCINGCGYGDCVSAPYCVATYTSQADCQVVYSCDMCMDYGCCAGVWPDPNCGYVPYPW